MKIKIEEQIMLPNNQLYRVRLLESILLKFLAATENFLPVESISLLSVITSFCNSVKVFLACLPSRFTVASNCVLSPKVAIYLFSHTTNYSFQLLFRLRSSGFTLTSTKCLADNLGHYLVLVQCLHINF